jgi:hypothetical protein
MSCYDNLEFHELANVFPMMSDLELADDIKKNGLLERITLFEGKILDGRNRYKASKLASYQFTEKDFVSFNGTREQAIELVISKNILRRHLTSDQRAAIAAELHAKMGKRGPGQPKKELSVNAENTFPSAQEQKQKAAAKMDVSVDKLETASAVLNADKEKHAAVKSGQIKLSQAQAEIKAEKQQGFPPEPRKSQKQIDAELKVVRH